jgi:hypothetical protein
MTLFISSITPINHLAFFEHSPIHFDSGVTLVLGKNNTGKTSLLRALTLELPLEIHNGPLNRPSLGLVCRRLPEIRAVLEVSKQAVRVVLSQSSEYSLLAKRENIQGNLAISIHDRACETDLRCECVLSGASDTNQLWVAPSYLGFPIPGAIEHLQAERECMFLNYRTNPAEPRGYDFVGHDIIDWPTTKDNELGRRIFRTLKDRVFRLRSR